MSGKQSNLTSKEIEDLQGIVTETLTSVYAIADKLAAFAKVASVQDYETSHTNADRIRNMSDEEMAERIASSPNFNCADYCDSLSDGCAFRCNRKERWLALVLNWLQSEAE